jgi:hypothetical protein
MSPTEKQVKELMEMAKDAYLDGDEDRVEEYLYEIMVITGILDAPISE